MSTEKVNVRGTTGLTGCVRCRLNTPWWSEGSSSVNVETSLTIEFSSSATPNLVDYPCPDILSPAFVPGGLLMGWRAVLARVLRGGAATPSRRRFLFEFDEAATDRESPGAGKFLRIVAGTRLRYLGRDFTANCSFSLAARLRRNSQVPACAA
jgi:hypothetical protein